MTIVRDCELDGSHGSAWQSIDDGSKGVELEYVSCLNCGARRFETVVETPDFETRLGGIFRVVRCEQCDLSFTNPRPTARSIAAFYPSNYSPHEGHHFNTNRRGRWLRLLEQAVLRSRFGYPPQPVGAGTHALALLGDFWLRGRRRRAKWLPFSGLGELLDFGCGAAQFLRQSREWGWSVQGLDPSPVVAARVKRETGIRVHVGSLPHASIGPDSLDAITMWSSLEHVHDPRGVVRAARESLRDGGLLLVYVPNLASWSFSTFQESWCGLDLPRHLVHFTPPTLLNLLEAEAFRIRSYGQIGRDGWLRRSARRAKEHCHRSRLAQSCRWKPLAMLVSRWSEFTSRSDSILVLAEKN